RRGFGRREGGRLTDITGGDGPVGSTLDILNSRGGRGAKEQMVLANSAAALVLAGRAATFPEGVELARNSILGGAAYKKLEELVKFSGGELTRFEEYAKSR